MGRIKSKGEIISAEINLSNGTQLPFEMSTQGVELMINQELYGTGYVNLTEVKDEGNTDTNILLNTDNMLALEFQEWKKSSLVDKIYPNKVMVGLVNGIGREVKVNLEDLKTESKWLAYRIDVEDKTDFNRVGYINIKYILTITEDVPKRK